MNQQFPDWYRIVAVNPTSDMVQKRWAAVETVAKWQKRKELLDLVRLVRGGLPPEAEVRTKVTEAARQSDAAFPSRDNDAELRVLAGAAIVHVMETSSNQADLVALGLISASFQGAAGDELLREFTPFARRYLDNEAIRVRAADSRPNIVDSVDIAGILNPYKAALDAAANPAATSAPTVTFINALNAALTKSTADHIRSLHSELDALREESNMFWWVFAAHSRDLNRPFGELGIATTCLVAAKELADLTTLIPGPRSAPALLERALAGVGKKLPATVDIGEAISASPMDWRKRWLASYPSTEISELAPIMTGVRKSLETDDPNDWISSFVKATGISARNVAPPVVSSQAYTESILVRAANTVEA